MDTKLAVSTLPIQIDENISFGSMTAPLYADIIAKKFGGCSYLFLNKLSSFSSTHDLAEVQMLNRLNYYGIHTEHVISDIELSMVLYASFKRLIDCGFVYEENHKVLICECGRVNILKNSIKAYSSGKNYHIDNGKIICSICGKQCLEVEKNVLMFRSSFEYQIDDIPSHPYHDNLLQIQRWLKEDGILISKEHHTGIVYGTYNIDIDFFWSLFVNAFNEDRIVFVVSNKHPVKIVILNELAHIFNKHSAFVIHPQIKRKKGEHFSKELEKYDNSFARLFLFYAPRWNTKECYYNIGSLKAIAKLRLKGREKLWEIVTSKVEGQTQTFELLTKWIEHEIYLQKDLKELEFDVL